MKKEVSDHLARAFFDAKPQKKKDNHFIFFVAVSVGFCGIFALGANFLSKPRLCVVPAPAQHLRFQKHDGPYALSFDFTRAGAKTASLVVELPRIDLRQQKHLRFPARFSQVDSPRPGAIKVGLFNARREGDWVYVSDVGKAWTKFSIALEAFQKIRDWTAEPVQLIFVVEEWNITSQKGQLLVDNLEFLAE